MPSNILPTTTCKLSVLQQRQLQSLENIINHNKALSRGIEEYYDEKNSLYSLAELSPSYTIGASIYEQFSQAEDYPGFIEEKLIDLASSKTLLDVGCGSGKYSCLLQPYANRVFALDKSLEQLLEAKNKCSSLPVEFVAASATSLPFKTGSFEAVLSSWVVGTIDTPPRRLMALNELKRVCAPGGKIILIENALESEFEILRGRGFPDTRTKEYNDWLLGEGFKVFCEIDTYFSFASADEAQFVFNEIWGPRLTKKIDTDRVEHKVLIFVFDN